MTHWLTPHAIRAMLDRDITPKDVEDTLTAPDRRYVSYRENERRVVHQCGDIAVVTAFRGDERWTVLTVLYRTEGPDAPRWASADGRPSGRKMSRRTRQKLSALLRHAETVLVE